METTSHSLSNRDLYLVTGIVYPSPGNVRKLKSLLQWLAKEVEANEPGCVRYTLSKEYGNKEEERFVVIEQYLNEEAYSIHEKSPWIASFINQAMAAKLFARPPEAIRVAPVSGFAR